MFQRVYDVAERFISEHFASGAERSWNFQRVTDLSEIGYLDVGCVSRARW